MAQYVNPIGKGLQSSRIDMGVDYTGSGPLYAIGAGQIVNIFNSGWPGGVFIALKLDTGQFVYYAEHIIPHVRVGDRVQPGTLIGTAPGGYPFAEIGWAAPPGTGNTMASQTGQSAKGSSQGDPGKYSTGYGVSMSNFIKSLGGPPGTISPGGVQGSVPNISGISTTSSVTGSGSSTIPAGCLPGSGLIVFLGGVVYALQHRTKRGWHIPCRQRHYRKGAREKHNQKESQEADQGNERGRARTDEA
jgi:hypothetical protein